MVVAQEKGYFREEDLDVELILMTASVANMALMELEKGSGVPL
jgi:ABC-type nitrate/sulfonate/bicarbonate transport system substrate-binding protein